MTQTSEVWRTYRGNLQTRILLAVLTSAGILVAATVWSEYWLLIAGFGFLAVVAALAHPMALVGTLAFGLVVFESIRGISWPGLVLAIAAAALMQWKDSRGLVRLWTVPLFWLGVILINPLLFLILGLAPAAMIVDRRRRWLASQPTAIGLGPIPEHWNEPVEQLRVVGFRLAGTIWFGDPDQGEAVPAVVFRLGDARGWLIGTDTWTAAHAFGGRHFFSSPTRWTVTLPHELGQHVRSHDVNALLGAHRRVLAHLAAHGIRPDRLSDDDALQFLIRQYLLDGTARRSGGWWLALRATIDEERNLRQPESPQCLLDSPAGRRRLDEWSAPLLERSPA